MKKTVLWVFSLIAVLSIAFYFFLYPKLEIVAGYNAKVLCSCVFVSGLDQATAESVELNFTILGIASNRVDTDAKKVYSNVLGMFPKVAVFREGLGCVLNNDFREEEIAAQLNGLSNIDFAESNFSAQRVKGSEAMQAAISKAFDADGEDSKQTRALVVLKDGKLLAEAYGKGIHKDMPLLGWSMTKSITATLAGILAKDGYWKLDDKMPIDGWEKDERDKITLRAMLNMVSGLKWAEDYGRDSKITKMLYTKGAMGAYAASVPAESDPGATWNYSSGTTNIIAMSLSDAFESKADYWQFPYERLFAPLGLKSFLLETDGSGHFVGSSYSYATGRDWAKLGQLYLNQGNWNGQQIINTTWVDFVREAALASDGGYGGQFWLNQADRFPNYSKSAYWMGGFQGQQVSIHPEEKVVVVRIGVTYDKEDFDFNEIIGGIVAAASRE